MSTAPSAPPPDASVRIRTVALDPPAAPGQIAMDGFAPSSQRGGWSSSMLLM